MTQAAGCGLCGKPFFSETASIVRQSDFGAYPVILRGCFDQGGGWRWAVNIDRRLALGIPCNRHQHAKSTSVIIMMVGDENSSDVVDVDPRLCKTSRYTVTGVNNVMHPVDGKQI